MTKTCRKARSEHSKRRHVEVSVLWDGVVIVWLVRRSGGKYPDISAGARCPSTSFARLAAVARALPVGYCETHLSKREAYKLAR